MSQPFDGSWAEAQASLLAQPMSAALRAWIESDTPYRPAYVAPQPGARTHTTVEEPWRALAEEMPGASVTDLCLTWLAREFGRS